MRAGRFGLGGGGAARVMIASAALICTQPALIGAETTSKPTAVAAPATSVVPKIARSPKVGVPVARDVRLFEAGGETRFEIRIDRPVAVDAFMLTAPNRVVVDLPEVRFDLGADPTRLKAGSITGWRYGLFATGRSRLVFDLSGPARLERLDVSIDDDGAALLVVGFVPASRQEATAEQGRMRAWRPEGEVGPAEATATTAALPQTDKPRRAKPLIVLDPGHGGLDAGTVSPATGTPEKVVVLEIAQRLKKKIEASGRYEVLLTRADDRFVPLGDRVKFARSHHADLLLSIHCDAEYDHSVRGTTVYTLAEKASDAQAAALAAKENQSDQIAGILPEEAGEEVADILIDLTMRETKQFSHDFATALLDRMKSVGRLVKGNPHRYGNLRVLKAHDVPSALVEIGFLSNKEDEALMRSPEWQEKSTAAILDSIDGFFAKHVARAPN